MSLFRTVPVGLFGEHIYIKSTLLDKSFGCISKLFSCVNFIYSIFSYTPLFCMYSPLLPEITFVSKYTGYTGSEIATILSVSNKSTIFPVSHFAPSDTNTSLISISMFLFW